MFRPTLSRRTLHGGLRVAAVASLALSAAAATAAAATSASAATAATPHFDASDTQFVVQAVSPPHTGSSGTQAFVEVQNPSSSLTLTIDQDFVVAGYNAAGQVIATASPANGTAFESDTAVPPGQSGEVEADFTVGGIDHIGVTNPSGQVSTTLPDRFGLVGTPATTPSTFDNSVHITGTVSNPTPYTQTGKVLVFALDAAGHLIGSDHFYVTNVPANGTMGFDNYYDPAPGEPAAASYAYIVDGQPDSAANTTNIPGSVPVKGDVYVGSTVIAEPMLYGNGKALGGKTIEALFRTAGQAPRVIGTGVTAGSGVANVKLSVPSIGEIYFEFPGDATYIGSTTGDLTYQVAPQLTLNKFVHKGKTVTYKHGSTVAFTGTYAHPGGEKVDLQEFINKHWRTIKTSGALHGTGAFTIHTKAPSKKGSYQYRLHVAGNVLHTEGVSSAVTLKVT